MPVYGMPGHLNLAFKSGLVDLKIKTATHTNTNAASVPMLVSSATVSIGVNAAISALKIPVVSVEKNGVLNFG